MNVGQGRPQKSTQPYGAVHKPQAHVSGHLWKQALFTPLEMPFLSLASPHSALPELCVLTRLHPNITPGLALNSSC